MERIILTNLQESLIRDPSTPTFLGGGTSGEGDNL